MLEYYCMGPELKTILLSMTPINELRGTIPLAIGLWHLSPLKAVFLACMGNMIPVFFLLWFWKNLAGFLMEKSTLIDKIFNWSFKRTRRRFYKKHSLYGNLALILFVAIPLPLTGAWTGTIASFIFGMPYWKSLGLIFIGVILAGILITLGTMGIISII